MVAGSLETVKTVSDVASNVFTIIVAGVGGGWAYWNYLRERRRWPKATLELVIYHRELSAEQTLLHTKVKIHNAGRGLMKLTRIRAVIRQVRPLPEATPRPEFGYLEPDKEVGINWEELEEAELVWGGEKHGSEPEIEPGENDEFGFDFIVPSTLETTYVYLYVENAKKRGRKVGWSVTNYYDLAGQAGGESAVNVVGEPATSATAKETV